jgi:hypothetical protein
MMGWNGNGGVEEQPGGLEAQPGEGVGDEGGSGRVRR